MIIPSLYQPTMINIFIVHFKNKGPFTELEVCSVETDQNALILKFMMEQAFITFANRVFFMRGQKYIKFMKYSEFHMKRPKVLDSHF